MRPLVIEALDEPIELLLLSQEVSSRRLVVSFFAK